MDRFHDALQIAAAHASIEADANARFEQLRGRGTPRPGAAQGVLGSDVLRYAVLRAPVGETTQGALLARYEDELAESLGNLVQRTVGLVDKLRPSVILDTTGLGPLDEALADAGRAMLAEVTGAYEEHQPHRALSAVTRFVTAAHRHVDEAAPWAEEKRGERARVDAIMATALEALRWISVVLEPVAPRGCARLRANLGLAVELDGDAFALAWRGSRSTVGVGAFAVAFPRVAPAERAGLFELIGSSSAARPAAPARPLKAALKPADVVSFEEFSRLDLRIGTVTACDRVPKSDRLLRLEVDLGAGTSRQIVAGVGKTYAPADLVGLQVLAVVNLAPMKLMGVESRGMIMAVRGPSGGDADLALVIPSGPRPPGARIA